MKMEGKVRCMVLKHHRTPGWKNTHKEEGEENGMAFHSCYNSVTTGRVEAGGWMPGWIGERIKRKPGRESCDYAWEKGQLWNHGLPNRPSDLFRQHCYVDFWYEISAIQAYREFIGVDRIMWETDFPHPTALWPDTEKFLAKALKGVPKADQDKMMFENAIKAFHLE